MIGTPGGGTVSTSDDNPGGDRVDDRLARAIEILDRLIAFDTTSSRSNLELIDWVGDYLARHGIAATLSSAGDGKANLFATIGPAPGRPERGGVILSGHTDVVPVAGQEWRSDPFTLTEKDGRLHGRGAADMKGFIALALALVPEATRRALTVPLHFAFTHDEEVGCLGAPALIRSLLEGMARPAMAIIGEPTSMQVANRQKGLSFFRTRITGREGHSSAPDLGVSAISAAAEIILEIGRLHGERTRRRAARQRLRPAAYDDVGRDDQRRHRGQHHRARLRFRVGNAQPAAGRRGGAEIPH